VVEKMPRWKALSEELDQDLRQFVVQLRRMKDRSGLSLSALAVKTGFSVSSWVRYLNGRTLPPEAAVGALAEAAGADPARLLVLRQVAAEARGNQAGRESHGAGEGERGDSAAPTGGPGATPRRRRRWLVPAAAFAGGTLAVTAVLVPLAVLSKPPSGASGTSSATSGAVAAQNTARPSYSCRYSRRGGEWYAGNSTSSTALEQLGLVGPGVAEVQCLLARQGDSPGGIDGVFGPLTERAVRRAQQQSGVAVDGIVGPHTWKVLRG
jgi:transcriptional regulator with XRE-family HTH domain